MRSKRDGQNGDDDNLSGPREEQQRPLAFPKPIRRERDEQKLSLPALTVERQEDVLSHRGVASSPVDRDGDRRDEKVVADAGGGSGRHRHLALDRRGRRRLDEAHRPGLGEGQADARAGLRRGGGGHSRNDQGRSERMEEREREKKKNFVFFLLPQLSSSSRRRLVFSFSLLQERKRTPEHAPHRRRHPAKAGRRRSGPAPPRLWRGPVDLWILPARRRPRDAHVRREDGREADRGRVPPGEGLSLFLFAM